MIPGTRDRVPSHTAEAINRELRQETEENVRYFARYPGRIGERLDELDAEWDIERAIELNASVLAFTGTILAWKVDRRFLALPAIVTAFLMQHAIQGWCPPVPVLRRLGFRTCYEIEKERQALKALRGDFDPVLRARDRAAAAITAASA